MPTFLRNESDASHVAAHLRACDDAFVPYLSDRVEIEVYARKLVESAVRFEAWTGGELVGLLAAYCNDVRRGVAFITSVSVLPSRQGEGIAAKLMKHCIEYVRSLNFGKIELEVNRDNRAAVHLYEMHGFLAEGDDGQSLRMTLEVQKEIE